ncbi:hypothetical protein [Arthrobacter castelli]|uniref:hypothetical protein n=1 Tax=Arthrobacter castelli TaxID=271431 RepID=UPI00055F398E|nr:hypothetical protein [Arthrobacter castelli]
MSERTIPILTCRNLDDVLPFYEALGFVVTFRQERPNPYLCLQRGDIDIHFASVAAFEPEDSLGSIILLTSDTGRLFDEFAAGLKERFGKLPVAGIPRITRPRRKQGTAGGFSVIDPGGNWIRISSSNDEQDEATGVFKRVMLNAARQGDARGDTATAISVLETGLHRHADARPVECAPVLSYLAELLIRNGQTRRANEVLSELQSLDLTESEKDAVSDEIAAAAELAKNL